MAKKTDSIFTRAQQIAESGSSKDCVAAIAELEALIQREQLQADAVRPPGQHVHAGGGRVAGTLPAGPRYQAAAESDDGEEAVADLALRFDRLTARLTKADHLLHAVKARRTVAEKQEKIDAAPGEAKRAIKALDALADRHQAAREELEAVHAELKSTFQALVEARKLDPAAPTLPLESFFRVGVELGHALPVRREATEGGISTPPRITRPLFGHGQLARQYAYTLVDVPKTLIEKTRALLGQRPMLGQGLDSNWSPDTSDKAVHDRLQPWYEELVRRLAAGDLEGAEKLGPPSYRRGKPVFEEDAA